MKRAKPSQNQAARSTPAEQLASRMVGGKLSQMATYSDLFTKTTDAILLLDLDNNFVLECNPAAERIFAAPASYIEKKHFLHWVSTEASDQTEKKLQALTSDPSGDLHFDTAVKNHKGENLVLEITACRLKLADYCEVIQVIAKDVTAARKAAAELVAANKRLADLSHSDAMTGLYNFRYLSAELANEHERALRYSTPYTIILCDVDHFKHFNDTNGHQAGDDALRGVAKALKERARKSDLVARYGGEEFLVMCPHVDAEQATQFAENLRANVAATDFPHGKKQPLGRVSISIGVASYPAHGSSPEEVLHAADEALYQAKEAGRNRVMLAQSRPATKKAATKKAA